MKIKTKSGAIINPLPLFGFLFLLLVALPLYFDNSGGQTLESPLGLKQYDILFTNEKMISAIQYLDLSSKYSTILGKTLLFDYSGIYEHETSGKPRFKDCGTYIYPRYTYKDKDCKPDFIDSFESYTQDTLNKYKEAYDVNLRTDFYVDVTTNTENKEISENNPVVDFSFSKLRMPIESKATYNYEQVKTYPSGIFGTYKNEKSIMCSTSDCFAQATSYFYDLYKTEGLNLPFVQEGTSPYTYEESINSDFFQGVKLYQKEPETGDFTKPGFDGAGFAWWIGEHTITPFFTVRKTAYQYYEDARAKEKLVCEKEDCTKEFILKNAKPGDLIFAYEEDNLPTHMAIYVGDDKIIHSSPKKGLTKESLSELFFDKEEKTSIVAIYRIVSFNENGRKNLPGYGPREEGENVNCVVNMDFTNVNSDSLRSQPGDVSKLVKYYQTEKHDVVSMIQKAEQRHPKISKEYILAIINTETGILNGKPYLEGTTIPPCSKTEKGKIAYCGLMQVGRSACQNVDDNTNENCDFKELEKGNFEMGILAGTARLEILMTKYPTYINPQNPNLYFLALAYNAGMKTTQVIMDDASKDTGTPVLELQWCQITKKNIKAGADFNGWGEGKIAEMWEYPNKVAMSLQQQCDGTIFANARSKSNSYLETEINFKKNVNINFDELEKVKKFVETVTANCHDKLDTCLDKEIKEFNKRDTSLISNVVPKVSVKPGSEMPYSQVMDTFTYTNFISRNQENDALTLDLAEQILDCNNNGQTDCICTFDVDFSLSSRYDELGIKIDRSGTIRSGKQTADVSGTRTNDEKYLTRLNFNPVSFYVPNTENLEEGTYDETDFPFLNFAKVPEMQIGIDKKEKTVFFNVYNEKKKFLIGDEKDDDFKKLAMSKLKTETTWIPYKEGYPQLNCRNNKHDFRLQAYLPKTNELLNFSIYLEDTVAPEVEYLNPEYTQCLGSLSPLLKWEVDTNDHFVHQFNFSLTEKDKPDKILIKDTFYVSEAQEIKTSADATTVGRLYKITTEDKTTYLIRTYLTAGEYDSGSDTSFKPSFTYNYSLVSIDDYDNKIKSSTEFKIPTKITYLEIKTCGFDYLKPQTNIKDLYGKPLTRAEKGNYREYVGPWINPITKKEDWNIIDPVTHAKMYYIEDIPNVICVESGSSVGKICAGTFELMEELNILSETYLVPMGYTMNIKQAFRNYDIQKYLFDYYNKETSKACNPDRTDNKICPHMQGGAIDINIYDGDKLIPSNEINKVFQEEIMCDLGFLRYGKEDWHFEFGTRKWKEYVLPDGSLKACWYGSEDILAPQRVGYHSMLLDWQKQQVSTQGESSE